MGIHTSDDGLHTTVSQALTTDAWVLTSDGQALTTCTQASSFRCQGTHNRRPAPRPPAGYRQPAPGTASATLALTTATRHRVRRQDTGNRCQGTNNRRLGSRVRR